MFALGIDRGNERRHSDLTPFRMDFSASQNGGSRQTLVLCRSMTTDRLLAPIVRTARSGLVRKNERGSTPNGARRSQTEPREARPVTGGQRLS